MSTTIVRRSTIRHRGTRIGPSPTRELAISGLIDVPTRIRCGAARGVRLEQRELVVPLDWVRPSDLQHEDVQRYDRILAAAVDRERNGGWRPIGPTDYRGLARLGRTNLRRADPLDPLLAHMNLRTAAVRLEKHMPLRPSAGSRLRSGRRSSPAALSQSGNRRS